MCLQTSKGKCGMNQSIALFVEVTKCWRGKKIPENLIQHWLNNEPLTNVNWVGYNDDLLFGLCCVKFPHSFSYWQHSVTLNNRVTDWFSLDFSFNMFVPQWHIYVWHFLLLTLQTFFPLLQYYHLSFPPCCLVFTLWLFVMYLLIVLCADPYCLICMLVCDIIIVCPPRHEIINAWLMIFVAVCLWLSLWWASSSEPKPYQIP